MGPWKLSKVFPSCFFSRSFQSDCTYVLVRDAVAGLFTILFGTQGPCDLQAANCKKSITVLVEDDTYHLDAAGSFCSEAPRRVRQSTAPTNDLPLFIFFFQMKIQTTARRDCSEARTRWPFRELSTEWWWNGWPIT